MADKPINRSKFWACPFFKWDAEHAVHCEGGRIAMPSRPVANAYMNAYCAGDWEKCTVAQGLTKYYEEENL